MKKKEKTETVLFGTENQLSNLNYKQINLEYNGLKVRFNHAILCLGMMTMCNFNFFKPVYIHNIYYIQSV